MHDDFTLSQNGGDELVHRALDCQIKGVSREERTVDVIMSTPAIDRHGERVALDWDLRSFAANPVVLWAHDARDLPLGRAENVRVERGALRGTIRFASAEANPKAEQVLKLFEERVLNAVSVGFIPHDAKIEKEDGEPVLHLLRNELVELSVTPTPANPAALAKMRAKALATRVDITEPPAPPEATPKTTQAAAPRKEEKKMSENTDLVQKLEELTTRNSELAINVGAANGRADTAEKALRDLEPRAKALETENAALKAQTDALQKERDTEKKRADDYEAKSIEQEVEALVGQKISKDEKPLFVDLRKSNPDLFTKMIAQRQPMRLAEQIVPADKSVAGSDDDLVAELKSAAS